MNRRSNRISLLLATGVGTVLLGGCLGGAGDAGVGAGAGAGAGEASRDGTADLVNATGRDDLRVVVLDDRGRERYAASLDPVFRLDTQDPRRDRQCLVDGDGGFEVRAPDGSVLVHHDFADREVCERQEIRVGPSGRLTWPE